MILIYKCNSCGKLFNLSFKAHDRGELNRKKELLETCSYCNHKNQLIINRIKATPSNYINFAYGFAFLLSIIMFVLAYFFFDFKIKSSNTNWQYYAIALFFLIPFVFAKVIIENELKAVQIFNRYYV